MKKLLSNTFNFYLQVNNLSKFFRLYHSRTPSPQTYVRMTWLTDLVKLAYPYNVHA